MPTQHAATLRSAPPVEHATAVTCPYPLTPPPDITDSESISEPEWRSRTMAVANPEACTLDDNTAAGMSALQEHSMYNSQDFVTEHDTLEPGPLAEKDMVAPQDLVLSVDAQIMDAPAILEVQAFALARPSPSQSSSPLTPSTTTASQFVSERETHQHGRSEIARTMDSMLQTKPGLDLLSQRQESLSNEISTLDTKDDAGSSTALTAHPEVDHGTKAWKFSNFRLSTRYPSSLLHPGSKFEGTQQSDRQIYNVSVTVLTVDVPQCTLSGYLKIEGLTPDHPTLTTFFKGEIIGGPNQKYSFQTRNAGWGATDKTDLMHWARFPAWRPLSREAKRDLSFDYPIPGTGPNGDDSWWQQEHIFMRWKEEFLVPDHRVRSIQGASFEGFYYICFNQIEGKISGIYFHARSEKYQQLELKHEGALDVWGRGVRPSMEFR